MGVCEHSPASFALHADLDNSPCLFKYAFRSATSCVYHCCSIFLDRDRDSSRSTIDTLQFLGTTSKCCSNFSIAVPHFHLLFGVQTTTTSILFSLPSKKHPSVHQEDPLKCAHLSHPSSFFFLLCFLLFFQLVLLLLVVISNCLQLPMFVASVDLAPTCCYPAQEHHPYFQPDASPLTSVGATGCGTSYAPSSAEGCVSLRLAPVLFQPLQ